jgi:DNA-binding transcriptional regulator GbsR (MarR family)
MVVSLLAANPEGMTLDEITESTGRTKDAVRHAIRGCGPRVVSTKIPGTRGKMLYHCRDEDDGASLEHWTYLTAHTDD